MANVQLYFDTKIDYKLISDTWVLSYKRQFNVDYWKWRFETNPNNKETYVGYIIDRGALCAYYAVSPTFIINENDIFEKVALMNMAMTHPNFQGKGYHIKIASKLHNTKAICVSQPLLNKFVYHRVNILDFEPAPVGIDCP